MCFFRFGPVQLQSHSTNMTGTRLAYGVVFTICAKSEAKVLAFLNAIRYAE